VRRKSTRGRNRRAGIAVRDIVADIVESTTGHGEVMRPRENGAAIPRLGADEPRSKFKAHDVDSGVSVGVFGTDSALRCGSSSIDGEGKRKRC
jgi:hypothetical protein